MYTTRTPLTTFLICAGLGIFINPALAQSFEDRWIIPKANAQEPAPPAPDPQNTQEPNSAAEERTTSPSAAEQNTSPSAETTWEIKSVGFSARKPPKRAVQNPASKGTIAGKASYITYTGGKTASGTPYKPYGLTAAHRTLPFGTRLRVTDLKTGRKVQVTVTDRGPFIRGRVLDLSQGAAQILGMTERGIIPVRAEVLPPGVSVTGGDGS